MNHQFTTLNTHICNNGWLGYDSIHFVSSEVECPQIGYQSYKMIELSERSKVFCQLYKRYISLHTYTQIHISIRIYIYTLNAIIHHIYPYAYTYIYTLNAIIHQSRWQLTHHILISYVLHTQTIHTYNDTYILQHI